MAKLTFGVVTDIHYAQAMHGNRCCRRSIERLQEAVDVFRSRRIPLLVNLGDSIDWVGNVYAELLFLDAVVKTVRRSAAEICWVIGNHDVQTFSKEVFWAHVDPTRRLGYYSFEHGPFHFVVLDCNFHEDGSDFDSGDFSWTHVWAGARELEWLKQDLQSAGDRPVIVLSHECLDEAQGGGNPDPHMVQNRHQIRACLEEGGKVIAVLSGHYHHGRNMRIAGIPYITFQSMVGEEDDQSTYAMVTISEAGRIEVEGFGRQSSFILEPET